MSYPDSYWLGLFEPEIRGGQGLCMPTVPQVPDEPYGWVSSRLGDLVFPAPEPNRTWENPHWGWWR